MSRKLSALRTCAGNKDNTDKPVQRGGTERETAELRHKQEESTEPIKEEMEEKQEELLPRKDHDNVTDGNIQVMHKVTDTELRKQEIPDQVQPEQEQE